MDSNKINVVGWYGKKNTGDESYKLAFPKIFTNYEFIFSENPIENADGYILGGGDVLTTKILEKFTKINKPKHIMSVTVSKNFDKNLLEGFRTIVVRDEASRNRLTNLNINPILAPDFSFILEYDRENGKRIIENLFSKEKHDLYNKKIAIIVNGHLVPPHGATAFEQSRFDRFAFDLSIGIDETPASFIFIPFGFKQPWDDRIANSIIASKCKWWKKNIICYEEMKVQEILDIISACDGVVSSRLHSSIFSAATEVPFIDITHNHKNKYFLETIKYEKASIGFIDFNLNRLTNMLKNIIHNTSASEEIGSIVSINKIILNELNKNILLS
jgi:polysaccharide pyruvyl transferase WcaK-like protein